MNHRPTILVVDDDDGLRELVRIHLQQEGYRILEAADGWDCLNLMQRESPDAVILDVMMPQLDGHETCRRIRAVSTVPILMLTARVQAQDIVHGLDNGADDYLTKPFNMAELAARIRALLRRVPGTNRVLSAGNGILSIDPATREVRVREDTVDLTPTEFQLLRFLAERAGDVVDHATLLHAVWGADHRRDNDYLKVYVWHIRRKIERDPRQPELLLTEWGVGYRLMS
jgi:two-component system, OmpR family, KDP operon response regulator KdpE